MTLLAQHRGRRAHPRLRTAADGRPGEPRTERFPGFCARCDQLVHVRLGAGVDSAAALCPACRTAEEDDRAASTARMRAAG
jgi:hypothetical protein